MILYDEHLHVDDTIQHKRFQDMMFMNYRPEYRDLCVVASGTQEHDRAYLVAEIKALDTPYEPSIDVLDHRVTTYVCSCDDFYYNRSMGIESGEITPPDLGACKHVVAAFGVNHD